MLPVRDKRQLLADWVRAERETRNWSQTDLAERMGKVRAVVNKIESASNDPTLDTLAALSKAFGYPVNTVLDVIGYEVNVKGDDVWVDQMNYKLSLIPSASRKVAEKMLDALIEEPQPAAKPKRAKA